MTTDEFTTALDAALAGTDRAEVDRLVDVYDDRPSLRSVAPYTETHDRIGAWYDAHRARVASSRVAFKAQGDDLRRNRRAREYVEAQDRAR